MGDFTGIPADAVRFYAELAKDNTKAFWTANKARYEAAVREPFTGLLDALADDFGEANVFRPYRDTRFSADKTPYKTHQGAIVQVADGLGWYVQLSADGLTTGGGFHHHAPDQVARFRAAVDDDGPGRRLEQVVLELDAAGFEVGGEQLKTRPRGAPADHPRLYLLRHKSLTATRDHGTPDWMSTPEVVDHVRQDWETIRPLVDWIAEHVGATTDDRRMRPR
jgi:uncharacterized protein (TIGR02453 family)